MKIAIIGSGISGLGAAYLLDPHHDITIYEKNNYIGGHSRTIDVTVSGKTIPVDTGFIVFNNWNYPNLLGFFEELEVPYENSDMSFGVSVDNGWLEYSSGGLFAEKKNIFRPQFLKMLANILRFNKEALAYIDANNHATLEECLDELGMGDWFRRYYLLAMGAAIWSCPTSTMMDFPARTFLRFFKNHGLLSVNNRPQWYTVSGGSREYTRRVSEFFKDRIRLVCGAQAVLEKNGQFHLTDTNGETEIYDQIVFSSHADETLKMLKNPTDLEKEILGSFRYQNNKIIVHTDESFMPHNKKCWASWIYLNDGRTDEKDCVSLSYWMNNLQNFETDKPVLVTLNPARRPQKDLILDEHEFSHPIFDEPAIQGQDKMDSIQGARGLWFCGAYQRYGFHEDGLLSAVRVAEKMGVRIPWH